MISTKKVQKTVKKRRRNLRLTKCIRQRIAKGPGA